MSNYLTDTDLAEVYGATFEARSKWRNILLALKIPPATISNVGTKWHGNPDDCYREGLSEWLKGEERSWEDMVEALSSPIVGHSDLARTIERDHVQSTGHGASNSTDEVDQNCKKINDDLTIFVSQRLGSGAFGVVFKGKYKGEICAVKVLIYEAKEMEMNMPMGETEEASKVAFDRECELLESLQHPNIVQFLSTAKHPNSSTILVVELMDCNLRSYFLSLGEESLTSECEISLSKDVSCGLAYIHSKQIIHRDLCGDNILLQLTQPVPIAKISDFGISRFYDSSKLTRTLTALTHRRGYLPPEAFRLEEETYNNSLDVFSLGAIMVQIVCKLGTIKSAKDRSDHVAQIPHTHSLRELIDSCLQEDMRRRSSASDIYASLASDLDPVEATKMKSKDTQLVKSRPRMSVILSFLSLLFCLTLLTAYSVSTRVTPQNGLRSASQALKYEDRGAEFLSPHELPESQPPSAETNQQVPHHPACFLDEDNVMRCNQCKKMTYSYIYASEVSQDDTYRSTDEGPPPRELRPPLTLKWRTGKDMPIEMGTLVQSVVIGDTMYVGGGFADDYRDQCTVMKLEQDQWTKLPEYTAELFAMTSLANQLVLVGGRDPRNHTRSNQQLAVFKSGEWTHPYPPMNIARSYSTAVSFNNHIIVAGGDDDGEPTSSVEVLDVASRRWYSAQSLPNPKSTLQSTLIGNTLYLMDHTAGATKTVHHVDLNELIAKALSNLDTPTLWQIIEDTPLMWSAPLGIGRSLLAIGGLQDDGVNPSSSIHLYQPDTRRWVKVEDLPTARHSCTCSVLPSGEVIVAGGLDHNHAELGYLNTVDIFSINS